MNRRTFLKLTGTAAAGMLAQPALAAEDASVAPATGPSTRPIIRMAPPKPGQMKVGCQRWGSGKLQFLLRNGVQNICASPAKSGPDGLWTPETVRDARRYVEDNGLYADAMYWGVPIDVLVPQKRDRAIERCKRQIEAAGKGGIPILAYNLHVRIWKARTGKTPGRGGSFYSAWDYSAGPEVQRGKPNIGPIDAEEMWGRIEYFLKAVVPVAAEAKVKLSCHPPDPPVPADNPWKIAQVLDTVDGLKKFVSICDSDYHGLTFCQGTISEMLRNPGEEIFDVIRWFGQRRKIMFVHFRNIRGGLGKFEEVYHDEGDVNMFKAAQTYKEVGFDGMLMPDHLPGHEEDPDGLQPFAWAYGYIRGIVQAVYGG